MSSPTIGVLGTGHVVHALKSSAIDLGITIHDLDPTEVTLAAAIEFAGGCDYLTVVSDAVRPSLITSLEREGIRIYPSSRTQSAASSMSHNRGPASICVTVARSPHGQAASWTPTSFGLSESKNSFTISPAPELSQREQLKAQQRALMVAREIDLIGVMTVMMSNTNGECVVLETRLGLHDNGRWTVDGSTTSHYEQHLRAIIDLPLGDTSMRSAFCVTGGISLTHESDRYRPYLHLMARTPALKFHMYPNPVAEGTVGYVSLHGDNHESLMREIEHTLDYFAGTIDE